MDKHVYTSTLSIPLLIWVEEINPMVTNLNPLLTKLCVIESNEAGIGVLAWYIHCNAASATVRASLSSSCWKSGGCLIGWYLGHLDTSPGKYQGPSTSQQGSSLLRSHLEGHHHLKAETSPLTTRLYVHNGHYSNYHCYQELLYCTDWLQAR